MTASDHHSSSVPPAVRPLANRRRTAFTLVEIMIVIAIIALLAALALPALLRARKRSQAVAIVSELRLIDGAIDQYALEFSKPEYSLVPYAAWKLYMKPGSRLYATGRDLFGQDFGAQKVGTLPTVPSSSWDTLTDIVDSSFWAPYTRGN